MRKQNKEFKISYWVVQIISLFCLIVGGFGLFLSINSWEELNLIHLGAILGISSWIFLFSLVHLIVHTIVYFRNKEKMTYRQYNSSTFDSETDVFKITIQNVISAIIDIILIILAIIL